MWTKQDQKKWVEENREHIRAYDRTRYAKNKPKKIAMAKHYYENNKDKVLAYHKELYGKMMASPEKREANKKYVYTRNENSLARIAGRPRPPTCEVCGSGTRICFDHDHATDKFRGWICHNCNMTLGHARDRVEVLEKLISYLRANESPPKVEKQKILTKSPIQL